MTTTVIRADQLEAGDWIIYNNTRMNERVVEVQDTRSGLEVKVYTDYGNGGEPAVSFWPIDSLLKVMFHEDK